MNDRVDVGNRVVLALLGLLLLAAGVLGTLTGAGIFGRRVLLLPDALSRFARHQGWFWWALAAAGVVVALLALRWLLAQLHSSRVGRLDLTDDDRDGLTVVHAGALTDAVAQEAEGLRGVTKAAAQLREVRGRRLVVGVDLADYADIPDVRRALEGPIVTHARQAVDDPVLPVEIELRQAARTTGRGLR